MNIYSWSKKIFSNTYTILKDGEKVGFMNNTELFSKTAQAKLSTTSYRFVSENWKNTRVKVYISNQTEPIAELKFSSFNSKAEIKYRNEIYRLKFLDIWQSNWQITKNAEVILKSKKASLSGGQANIDDKNAELLLIALYSSNYFYTLSILMLMVIMIIIISN